MGRKRVRGGLSAGLALLIAACYPARPHGGTAAAPTIVSLNPCLDAIIVEVAPSQVLALSHYSRDPGSSSIPAKVAARYTVTGGAAEEVIALDPDLVLASSFLPQPTRSALERAGLKVEMFGSPTTIADSIAQVRQVAALAGNQEAGERLVADISRAAAPATGAHPVVATLLWQPGEIVPGEATVVAEMLRAKGFANHAAAMGLSQADFVPLETVLADPPDLLLVAGNSVGQRHPLLADFSSMRVEPLEPRLLFCGGPTIIDLAQRLDAIREGGL